ncbi:hypothetical protein MVEN_02644100 [Mycena venus]|uniref:Uncharacterized protein n=1 Tax=Mycena venus TaxID=2733690 RepID=A0A8H6TXB6_9AGAR|nr:hypothetical protein MVEN_02644100 [Mycena venus]
MKSTLCIALSTATAAFAANVSPAHVKTIDAASYKALGVPRPPTSLAPRAERMSRSAMPEMSSCATTPTGKDTVFT